MRRNCGQLREKRLSADQGRASSGQDSSNELHDCSSPAVKKKEKGAADLAPKAGSRSGASLKTMHDVRLSLAQQLTNGTSVVFLFMIRKPFRREGFCYQILASRPTREPGQRVRSDSTPLMPHATGTSKVRTMEHTLSGPMAIGAPEAENWVVL